MGKASRLKKERREASSGLTLWHYTTSAHIKQIFESGALKPTAIRIDEGERPALWLSTNPDWERTVTKRINVRGQGVTPPLQRDDLVKIGIKPIRIMIDSKSVKVYDWIRFKKMSGILRSTAQELENKGMIEGANPSEWYACFDQIPLDKWVTIDFWEGDRWIIHNIEEYFSMKEHELIQEIEAAHNDGRMNSNG